MNAKVSDVAAMTVGKSRARTRGGLIKLSFQLTQEQVEQLEVLAQRKRLPLSSTARMVFELGIQQQARLDRLAEAVA
jgi:hypothetical protein